MRYPLNVQPRANKQILILMFKSIFDTFLTSNVFSPFKCKLFFYPLTTFEFLTCLYYSAVSMSALSNNNNEN